MTITLRQKPVFGISIRRAKTCFGPSPQDLVHVHDSRHFIKLSPHQWKKSPIFVDLIGLFDRVVSLRCCDFPRGDMPLNWQDSSSRNSSANDQRPKRVQFWAGKYHTQHYAASVQYKNSLRRERSASVRIRPFKKNTRTKKARAICLCFDEGHRTRGKFAESDVWATLFCFCCWC